MKKTKRVAAAHALLGLVAGVPATASAQQLTPPARAERLIPEVDDLQTTQASHLGQLETKRQALSTALALTTPATGSAGKIAMNGLAGAVERSGLTTKSANTTAATTTTPGKKEISFPDRSCKIAAHGSLAQAVPVMALVRPAPKASSANSINPEPVTIESITN